MDYGLTTDERKQLLALLDKIEANHCKITTLTVLAGIALITSTIKYVLLNTEHIWKQTIRHTG